MESILPASLALIDAESASESLSGPPLIDPGPSVLLAADPSALPPALLPPAPPPPPLLLLLGTSSRWPFCIPSPIPPLGLPPRLPPIPETPTMSSASRSVSPVSSSAARNLASSLQSSQSPSRIALPRSLTLCSLAVAISSKVCRISR